MANDKTNGKNGGKPPAQISNWLGERSVGTYADGRRFDEVAYLQCKLILKPDRFTSARVFKEFATLVRRAAEATGIGYQHTPKSQQRPEVREVLFLDTGGYHLYNNQFIVRRRIAYERLLLDALNGDSTLFVRRDEAAGRTRVAAIDPVIALSIAAQPALEPVARHIRERLERVLAALEKMP